MIWLWASLATAAPFHAADGTTLLLNGFVDVGWFDVGGTGRSYRRRDWNPDRPDQPWRFTGDPWAAAVNSQGDVADLGGEINNLARHDAIASGGRPTFLVNAVEQAVIVRRDHADAEVAVWLEPRGGLLGDLGDEISVDRAFVTWHPLQDRALEIDLGKIESLFGLEWYVRRAPDRPGVTPSLVARYTTGRPVGLAARGHALDDRLMLGVSVTNGGTTTERFGHFTNELDSNGVPTGTVRIEVAPSWALTLGLSGQAGAQDGVEAVVPMFQVGADVAVNAGRVYLRAEYLLSDQDQGDPGAVDRLRAHGGYLLAWAVVTPGVVPLVRLDRRVARMEIVDGLGVENRYDSDVARLTGGLKLELTAELCAKAEYLHLWELKGEAIDDDVVTTSVVFQW